MARHGRVASSLLPPSAYLEGQGNEFRVLGLGSGGLSK